MSGFEFLFIVCFILGIAIMIGEFVKLFIEREKNYE